MTAQDHLLVKLVHFCVAAAVRAASSTPILGAAGAHRFTWRPPISAFGTRPIGLFPRPPMADRHAASPRVRASSLQLANPRLQVSQRRNLSLQPSKILPHPVPPLALVNILNSASLRLGLSHHPDRDKLALCLHCSAMPRPRPAIVLPLRCSGDRLATALSRRHQIIPPRRPQGGSGRP
jgi:hypothetical protein